jgi:hypothetical protein
MPYELAFNAELPALDRERYMNECCVGGDVVVERLLPAVKQRYTGIQTNQEDWGWFIWFRDGKVKLAIDVFTDDPDNGAFRIHLTARKHNLLWIARVEDTPELETLRQLIESELSSWTTSPPNVSRVDRNYT